MVEINNRTRQKIKTAFLKSAAEKFLSRRGFAKRTVSVALVGDAVMRRLNREYLGRHGQTDVFAFNYGEPDKGPEAFEGPWGEIIINYAQVRRQARRYGHDPAAELLFVLVHGLLHLAGHDDKSEPDRRKMDRLAEFFLKSIKDNP